MTEPRIVDTAERTRALDISASFIVQAPAGSGKTELLTQRFLRLLAVVEHPEEICAITFTRKAAAEMRNRILAALDAAGGAAPEAAHRRLTWDLARAALQRDAQCGWQLASNPNRLRVQTFDSLAATLARQLPILSEFGATPVTTEQSEPHHREAARRTLRQLEDTTLGPALAQLLVHLDNRQSQLEDLLCAMLARRDQWLSHVLRAPDGSELEAALRHAVEAQLQRLLASCDADWLHRLSVIAGAAAQRIDDDKRALSPLGIWQQRDTPPEPVWEELPAWRGLAELLLTRQGGVRRSWTAGLGFPAPSATRGDADEQARRKQAKADVADLAGRLADEPELAILWDATRGLPQRGLDAQQHGLLESLFQVLLQAVAELTLVFRDAGEVDFVETQLRAQRALGEPDAPTELALALDYRLQHLLVDEFQDTSSGQYRLLETLTASWQFGDGRTLFTVGDPMQSIYRFREAEVGLYLAAREHGIGQLPLTPLTLAVNFRSTQGIVDWINRGFAQIFPPQVDIARGAVDYAASQAHDTTGDAQAVQVHPFAADDTQAEAALVVSLVRDALADSEHGQVAVLARARRHLHAIAAALKQAGLPFQAVDVDPLAGRAVVQDLYQLTRALLHPADRLAWLSVLHAPWLGLDLPDLLVIAEGSARCIIDRLQTAAVRKRLSEPAQRRVERLLAVLDGQLPARGRRPLRQWIEGIWLQLGGQAIADAGERLDAQAYLALLDAQETAGGLLDFGRLEAAMDGLYAAPDGLADGRVQLMTMHKSKGLEFDTVILPGLGRRPAGAGSELLYWDEVPDASGHTSLLMAPVRAARQTAEPISDYLRERERDKTRLESTRLLYVAATRARRRLHLLGHIPFNDAGEPRPPAAGSLLEKLWPVVADAFDGLQPPPGDPTPVAQRLRGKLRRLPADWQAPQPDADADGVDGDGAVAAIRFDWAGDTARHVGTLVHRQLERIAAEGIDDWPAARVDGLAPQLRLGLRHLGVDDADLDAALDKAMRALRQTLQHDTGRWLLYDHTDARSEWPLSCHDGEGARHYVIDRSFVDDDGVRWIVDYKTGEHQGGNPAAFLDDEQSRYREQLQTYARLLRRLERRPIRLALYFPLLSDWRVWDYEDESR